MKVTSEYLLQSLIRTIDRQIRKQGGDDRLDDSSECKWNNPDHDVNNNPIREKRGENTAVKEEYLKTREVENNRHLGQFPLGSHNQPNPPPLR